MMKLEPLGRRILAIFLAMAPRRVVGEVQRSNEWNQSG